MFDKDNSGLGTSGDIDIIITNPKIGGLINKEKYLSRVVEECINKKKN